MTPTQPDGPKADGPKTDGAKTVAEPATVPAAESGEARFACRLAGRPTAETLVKRLVAAEDEHLAATLHQVAATGALPAAAALVVGARRRYVTGTGKSLAFATLLAADLAVSCSHVHLIDDATVPALDVLAEVTAADVLVAYSFRRYRHETAALARAFAAAGGSVVAVSDAVDAPLAARAAVTVVVDTGSASFVDSPTAVVAVSHILATLVGASAKGARRRIATRDRLAAELDLYLAPTPEA